MVHWLEGLAYHRGCCWDLIIFIIPTCTNEAPKNPCVNFHGYQTKSRNQNRITVTVYRFIWASYSKQTWQVLFANTTSTYHPTSIMEFIGSAKTTFDRTVLNKSFFREEHFFISHSHLHPTAPRIILWRFLPTVVIFTAHFLLDADYPCVMSGEHSRSFPCRKGLFCC